MNSVYIAEFEDGDASVENTNAFETDRYSVSSDHSSAVTSLPCANSPCQNGPVAIPIADLRGTDIAGRDRGARETVHSMEQQPEIADVLAVYDAFIPRFVEDLGEERDILLSRGAAIILIHATVAQPHGR